MGFIFNTIVYVVVAFYAGVYLAQKCPDVPTKPDTFLSEMCYVTFHPFAAAGNLIGKLSEAQAEEK